MRWRWCGGGGGGRGRGERKEGEKQLQSEPGLDCYALSFHLLDGTVLSLYFDVGVLGR